LLHPGPTANFVLSGTDALWCNITSRPAPSIFWYHNGDLIVNGAGYDFTVTDTSSTVGCGATLLESRLDILRVMSNMTGEITCAASYVTNETNWRNNTVTLDIQCKLQIIRNNFKEFIRYL